MAETFMPFDTDAKLLRIVPHAFLGTSDAVVKAALTRDWPARFISGWEELDDYPDPVEHDRLGIVYAYDFHSVPDKTRTTIAWSDAGVRFDNLLESRSGPGLAEAVSVAMAKDKLGGWPKWVQGVEYPMCPRCGTPMRCFFQIDSNDNLPYMWGDAGCGHITYCERHPNVLAFTWACS